MVSDRKQYTIVQLTVMDQTGDSYYRMRWPAAELAAQAPNWRVINLDARANERHRWALEADLLILYQAADPDLLPLLRKRRALGRKTLVEYNDNFYEPPSASPVAKEWASPLLWQSYERVMSASDGILVTGPGLRDLFATRFPDKQITILENNFPRTPIPFETLLAQKTATPSIGWAGSLGHMADLLAVGPLLKRLLAEFPTLKLHVMGNDAIPNLLNISSEKFIFQKWGSVFEYFEFWKSVQIGFAPLLDTPYNRCRSDVKAIEMAAHGVAPLLKRAVPYEEFTVKTGCRSYESQAELEKTLRDLINNPREREAQARRCYDYVCAERLGIKNTERLSLYQKFLPAEPNSFEWNLALGYHEIIGETVPHSTVSHALNAAEQKRSAGEIAAAATILKNAIAENPDVPEPGISLIKFLLRNDPAAASAEIARFEKLFPDDLRFLLLGVSSAQGAANRRDAIEKLLAYLKNSSAQYRRFFRKQAVEIFARALERDRDLVDAAVSALQIFPEAMALHFKVAEALERIGRDSEAAQHLAVVQAALESSQLNAEFLAGADNTYIQTWHDALIARNSN